MRPWLCSNDHPREAGGTSVTHIANAHRTTIARPTKLPTFLLYSTVPVAQSAAVSLNLGIFIGFSLCGFFESIAERLALPGYSYARNSGRARQCRRPV